MASSTLRRSKRVRNSQQDLSSASHQRPSKSQNSQHDAFHSSHCDKINFEAIFQIVYSPERWSCISSGTTDDVFLLLGSGKVLQRRLALAEAAHLHCPLLLEINGHHKVFAAVAGALDDVTAAAAAACPPLRAARKGLAAMQPHNRVPPTSAAARWARLRALVRFMTLPCFSSSARRQRQAEALHRTAALRMRNLLLHRAFAAWRSVHQPASGAAAPAPLTVPHIVGPRLCGLRNLGNTCYLNATLQCVLHCQPLRDALCATPDPKAAHKGAVPGRRRLLGDPPSEKPAVSELQACLGALCRRWAASPAPSLLVPQDTLEALWRVHPQFVGFRQQDAQELLCALLGSIEGVKGGGTPPVPSPAQLFSHTTTQQAICGACGHTSERQQECAAPVTVSVPPAAVSFRAPGRSSAGTGGRGQAASQAQAALPDMLQHELCTSEPVDGMQCEACGKRGTGQRRVALLRPPRVLAVHVNRTSWAHGGRKVQTHVHAPLQLALSYGAAAQHSASFALTGVVVHHGRSLSCGHYTACARSAGQSSDAAWLMLNDDRVSCIAAEEVQGQQVYLCFYQRV